MCPVSLRVVRIIYTTHTIYIYIFFLLTSACVLPKKVPRQIMPPCTAQRLRSTNHNRAAVGCTRCNDIRRPIAVCYGGDVPSLPSCCTPHSSIVGIPCGGRVLWGVAGWWRWSVTSVANCNGSQNMPLRRSLLT